MNSLKENIIKKYLQELKNSLECEELIQGYFETSNYSAEKRRKSPFVGPDVFGYLFVLDEWIWNTLFVLTNKKLYLINTNDKFEKVSTNEIILNKIDSIDIYTYNQGTMIELKVHGQEKLQYKPISNNYLDILTKLDKLKIFENKKPKL